MRNTLLLTVCLMLGACGMKGALYEPAPATAGAAAGAEAAANPAADQESDTDPRGDRKTVPATPDPGLSR
ncbi:MAG: lipoprotein [Gammaproteobacteria bacterium]